MSRTPTRLDFDDYSRMVGKLAGKILRRDGAAAKGLTFEDLIQEGYIVFLNCVEKFDPDKGVKFSTYLYTAASNRFTTLATPPKIQMQAMSESMELEEVTPCRAVSASERVERMSEARANVAKLSPVARGVLTAWVNPPPSLKREFERVQAFKPGNARRGSEKFDMSFVMRAMGYDAKTRDEVSGELRKFRGRL